MSRSRSSAKPMRLPNGYGQIHKMSGTRRKPYAAYPPTKDYSADGKPIRNKAIGYYATYQEALAALSEYNKIPYDLDMRDMTFAQVYKAFTAEKFGGKKQYSEGMLKGFRMAYNHSEPLYNIKFRDLRTDDFQKILDESNLKYSSLEFIVFLYKQMSRYALQHDIIFKNYAQFCSIPIDDDDEHGIPFSEAEMRLLWSHTDLLTVRQILVMCYSGFRVSAYATIVIEDDCFRGGVKTGKNRLVPIHSAIKQWSTEVIGLNAKQFRKSMRSTLKRIGCTDHTPHDCRHTCSWLLTSSGCDDFSRHLILGHSIHGDIENKVYTHRTTEELRKVIEACPTFAE